MKIPQQDNWCSECDKKCATTKWLNIIDISSNEWNQIYLQSKSSIESSHRISKPIRNPNPNLNNLVIGFCHQSCTFWKIGLNGYYLLLLGGLQRVGLLRGREKIVYWCMPLFLLCFLSTFYHFLSLFLSIHFTLSFLLLSCRGFSFLGLSFSWVPLSGCLPL